MEEMLNTTGPALIEPVIDPYEPPNVEPEQAERLARPLLRSTPNRPKMAVAIVSDKVREPT